MDAGKNDYTRFEVARIIGARALQISMGAPILLKMDGQEKMNPLALAKMEYDASVIPLTVKRKLPKRKGE
ncbi:DNA-directed RNA polymerase subunit K [archaeon]|nr:MAG: DNA-directed RNA polymerase subunit K [archaeon]